MARPFFLPAAMGLRFCLYHAPAGCGERGAILYLHPFAEELNKSRRMAALQARAMAAAGYHVLQMDLLGCGDSSGDFVDATWQAWREDVLLACQWLRGQTQAPLTLWGLRAGCLLAANAAVDLPEKVNFIFWHPVFSGKQHWQQFMRLKMAGELAAGKGNGGSEQLRQQLLVGRPVEIGGYSVAPALAEGLAQADLRAPTGSSGRVNWFELTAREGASLTPATQINIEQWQASGFTVAAEVVTGPSFWQTAEIEDAPKLLAATLAALELAR